MQSQYIIRKIVATDFNKNLPTVLSQLSNSVKDISQKDFDSYIQYIEPLVDTYYVVVIEDTNKDTIVGMGSLILEHKLIHHLGKVAHIEDIVIDESYRGYGLGKMLMNHLRSIAAIKGCYKIILNCSEDNIAFYEKCGYFRHEIEMRLNLEESLSKMINNK